MGLQMPKTEEVLDAADMKKRVLEKLIRLEPPLQAVLPRDFNVQLHWEAERGAADIHLRLDRATQHGQDAEALEAEDIRRAGLSLSTLADAHRAFTGVLPCTGAWILHAGAEAAPMLGMFAALLAANGQMADSLRGMIGADPLGMLAAEGTLPMDPPTIYDELAQTVLWTEQHMPAMRTVLVDTRVYHEAGASAAQEIAYAIATGVDYAEALQSRGLDLDSICHHMGFCFISGTDSLLDAAKFQVMAGLWRKALQTLSKKTFDNGTAVYVLSAIEKAHSSDLDVLGTAQQQKEDEYILSRVGESMHVLQPAERLLQELYHQSEELLHGICLQGGMLQALSKGFVQKQLSEALQWRLNRMAQRMDPMASLPAIAEEPSWIDTERIREERLQAIHQYRMDVDEWQRDEKLSGVYLQAANGQENVVDELTAAFLAGASLAEAVIALHTGKMDFYIENRIVPHVIKKEFLQLREWTADFYREYEERPNVFLCNLGSADEYGASANLSADIFEPGGFMVTADQEFVTADEAAHAALTAGASIVVICASDLRDSRLVFEVAHGIKQVSTDILVFVAGTAESAVPQELFGGDIDAVLGPDTSCLDLLPWLRFREKGGRLS